MNSKLNPLRAILLTLLTCLILFLIGAGVLYFRDSYVMREGDIAYNSGDYISALSRYRVLQQVFPFKQEAFQKADYCLYNLGQQAMDNEEWEEAKDYLSQVKAFELDSVNKMMAECDKEIEAEADRARSYDQIFLEDLEKAITLRLDPDDDGDVVVRELMFLKDYDHRYFQDQKLQGYAMQYLDALQKQLDSRAELYESEKQVKRHDAELQNFEILVNLYNEYGFMADNVQFVGEYVGELESVRAFNRALHEVYIDMHSQADKTDTWVNHTDYASPVYYHVYRNNTPYTISVTFVYYIFTQGYRQYLGEGSYSVNDIPPAIDYMVKMSENENQNGVSFLIDWTVTEIK